MSPRILVFQHLGVEHPGIFRDFMREQGLVWDCVELDQGDDIPALDNYAGLIVMGGPMDVWEESEHPWLIAEKTAIRDWVQDLKRPFLGVCLGHQLLADALGGQVGKAANAEVGVMPVNLTTAGQSHAFFNCAPPSFPCLQWHGAAVLQAPAGAEVLAASELCPIQALAIGKHAFSFQFHVEVTDTTVDDWQAIPAYQQSLTTTLGTDGADNFRAAAAQHMPEFNRLARVLYNNWRQHAFN